MLWWWVLMASGVMLAILVSIHAIEHDENDTDPYTGWWTEKNEDEDND